MSRARSNDALGVSNHPNVVTDPKRQEELISEFRRRVDYALESNAFWRETLGHPTNFNQSLSRLKEGLGDQCRSDSVEIRQHPEVEMAVAHFSKIAARKRTSVPDAVVTDKDTEAGVREALAVLKTPQGRPGDPILTHHVEGLMALIQEFLGKPVMMQREKNSIYDPQASNEAGELLLTWVRHMEPNVSVTTVVNIVRKARRHYAGKRMNFLDYFPFYGATADGATGEIKLQAGLRFEQLGWASPIYCP
ncbi:hypothetical protein [Sphingobium tyrosinilyticum]|uniref:Uncharacterized protein n=1 Tax=Sphingobium tyrosinilyticum TaxID=2715436 RepID=A0ABV9F3V7_9SPHN